MRAARGEKHPVYDFLFTYYAFRPAWLRRWHPGPDVILTGPGAREFLHWAEYREVDADVFRDDEEANSRAPHTGNDASPMSSAPRLNLARSELRVGGVALEVNTLPAHRGEFVGWLRSMLRGMQTRPAFYGCYGLHEWAMVYRQTPEQIRHNAWPLRFSPSELAAIVERSPLCCSHFDAFRFFTAPAQPLNRLQPTREDTAALEQRGCLHANMDLYKWAFKLAPYTPSELVADCFELARDIREVDMRASPYDLRELGFEPIPVETAEGRGQYEAHQRAFAARGEPLRARLIALCDRMIA